MILNFINKNILGPALPVFLIFSGFFFLFRLRFKPLIHPFKLISAIFRKNSSSGTSPFKAVTVALAGTLGVGNIVGVAAAITSGGAGAVFWMWAAAVVSMVLKYAEIVLAVQFREKTKSANGKSLFKGGAPFYILHGLRSRCTAIIFALLCILASFPLGNIIQVKAAADSAKTVFGIPPLMTGLISAAITMIVSFRGIESISGFTAKLIPILSAVYTLMSLTIIIANYSVLPNVIGNVFSSAFTLPAISGGGIGYIILRFFSSPAIRFGAARGLFSNEAGCGTAPYAHASAKTKSPAEQGLFGIFEVFVDTILLCSMTAFVILIYYSELQTYDGMELVLKAYSCFFGKAAGVILAPSIFFFAIASVISWSFYGTESIGFITNKPFYRYLYLIFYCLISVAGAYITSDFIWNTADFALSVMTLLNLICLLLLSDKVKKITDGYF